jgi:hypothetical protein
MRINLKQITCVCAVAMQMLAVPAHASIPRADVRRIDFSLITNYSIFDQARLLPVVPRVLALEDMSSDDLSLSVTPSLQAESNGRNFNTFEQSQATSAQNSQVGKDLLNQNINRMLQAQKAKGGAIGSTANRIQNTMQTDVDFGSNDPGAIHHKVRVKLNAAQGQAVMDYSGFMNAQLSYGVGSSAGLRAAVIQKLDDSTNLVIDHTTNHTERVERVSLSFNF